MPSWLWVFWGIHTWTNLYPMRAFQSQISRPQRWEPAFNNSSGLASRVDWLIFNMARDVLFSRMWPSTIGAPPETCWEPTMRMIDELKCTTNELKERWIGHPDITPRVFSPEEYIKAQKIWKVKPMLTSKPLPAAGPQLKLIITRLSWLAEFHKAGSKFNWRFSESGCQEVVMFRWR